MQRGGESVGLLYGTNSCVYRGTNMGTRSNGTGPKAREQGGGQGNRITRGTYFVRSLFVTVGPGSYWVMWWRCCWLLLTYFCRLLIIASHMRPTPCSSPVAPAWLLTSLSLPFSLTVSLLASSSLLLSDDPTIRSLRYSLRCSLRYLPAVPHCSSVTLYWTWGGLITTPHPSLLHGEPAT